MKNKIYSVLILLCMFFLVSCNLDSKKEETIEAPSKEEAIYLENVEIATTYQDIYEDLYQNNLLGTLEAKQRLADCIGQSGYAVSDTKNEINMVNAEQVEDFCEAANQKLEAKVTILLLRDDGGFIRYDLKSMDGKIDVTSSTLLWEDVKPIAGYYEEFSAHTWSYTDKGYLFIEQYRPPGYDGAPGQIGIRVKTLNQKLRELNMKYVAPVGYIRNKLLISNWSEDDFSALDFYDLYEIMYRLKYGSYVPCESGIGGNEYEIPENEFEEVIQSYFSIDSSTLKALAVYSDETQSYRYRPRGLYDAEYPYEPYPEVVAFEEMSDSTLKLTIEAVWTYKNMDRAVTSELIVRPLENGTFQYVSNQMITSERSTEPSWYQPRLTDKEWTELYGGASNE